MAAINLTWFDFVLLFCASYSLAEMISREKGPWDIFTKLRERLPLGGLTSCVKCTVRWIAIGLFIVHLFTPVLSWVLAISGAALLIRSYTGAAHDV